MALGGSTGTGGASQSAIKAGEAFYELSANDKKLRDALQHNINRVRKFGAMLRGIGAGMAGLGTAIALPIGKAAMVFANFDDKMRMVKAVTPGTAEEFDNLTNLARHLGKTTAFTASEVAGLMIELGKAGFTRREINDLTASILNLARATGTDAALSAEIASTTMRKFGLASDQTTKVVDLLTVTANSSAVSVTDLGESFKYIGPTAADLNMSLSETLALLGVLGNLGIKGEMAGTTLRRLVIILSANSEKIQQLFGVSTMDAQKNLRPAVDILTDIYQTIEPLGTGERTAKLTELFGILGITGVSALSKNTKSIKEFRSALENADGTAAKAAQEMDAGLGGAIRRLKGSFESMVISLGEAASPELMAFGSLLKGLMIGLDDFIKNNRELVGIITTIAIVAIPAGVALAGLGIVFAGIVAGAIALKTAIVALIGVALAPLTLKIAAVAAVLTLLGYAFTVLTGMEGEVVPALKRIAGIIGQMFGGIIAAIRKGDLRLAGNIILAGFVLIFKEVELFVTKMWVGLKSVFVDTFDDIIFILKNLWNDFTTFLGKTVVNVGMEIVKIFSTIFGKLNQLIKIANEAIQQLPEAIRPGNIPLLPIMNEEGLKELRERMIANIQKEDVKEAARLNKEAQDIENARKAAREKQIKDAENEVKRFKDIFNMLIGQAKEAPIEAAPMPRAKEQVPLKPKDLTPEMAEMARAVKGAFQSSDFRGVFAFSETNKEMKEQTKTLKGIKGGIDQVNKNLEGLVPAEFE